jgi:hypothetical protein
MPDPIHFMDQQLLNLLEQNPDKAYSIRDLYRELQRPVDDLETRTALWRLLNNGRAEMTPQQTFKKRASRKHSRHPHGR